LRFIMKIVASVVATLGLAIGAFSNELSFEDYVSKYEKGYEADSAEYYMRKFIYETELDEIRQHNSNLGASYTKGVNMFTDMTPEEKKKFRGHNKNMRDQVSVEGLPFVSFSEHHETYSWGDKEVPKEIDWRRTKYLAPVKNQEACGSCWAFSATTSIESAWALANDKAAPILGPQELVDCAANPRHCGGTGGCEGATAQVGFRFATEGMSTMEQYPYTAKDGKCESAGKPNQYAIDGFINVPTNDANALMAAVAFQGPISISVDANSWSSYEGGIYDGCKQNADIDHAVVLVGYTETYWIVRNSWSENWGEKGYIYLKKYADEPCGIDSTPSDGSACDGDTAPVKVCGMCGMLTDSSFPFINKAEKKATGFIPEDELIKMD
jgi:cathepsin L